MSMAPIMAAFIDSTLRRLIFPYLELVAKDSDDKTVHWLSNLTQHALGRGHLCVS